MIAPHLVSISAPSKGGLAAGFGCSSLAATALSRRQQHSSPGCSDLQDPDSGQAHVNLQTCR
jgi:hypothetical protein